METYKRINYLAVFISLLFFALAGTGVVFLIGYVTSRLNDFIINTLQINEFYADKLIGFFFLLCSGLLFVIVLIVDGEERRLRKVFRVYASKLVVKDYYGRSRWSLAGAKADDGDLPGDPDQASTRAALSVRPKASQLEEDYQNGSVSGTFKEYHPNGILKREVHYIDGKMNGLFRTYYEDGQVEQEALYLDGQMEGLYRSYYKDSTIHQEKELKAGKLNGVYKAYDEFGVPFFEISYRNNVQHGADKTFDQKGVLQYLDTYRNGILINRKTYDEYGYLKFEQHFQENLVSVLKKEAEESVNQRENELKEKRRQKKHHG